MIDTSLLQQHSQDYMELVTDLLNALFQDLHLVRYILLFAEYCVIYY